LSGKRLGTTVGHSFCHNVVIALDEPPQVFITSRTAIQAPDCAFPLLRR